MSRVDPSLVDTFRALVCGELPWPLFLFGPVGSGKTHAALSLCDFVDKSHYTTVEVLMNDVMDNDCDPWIDVRSADVAVLDEIGCRVKVTDLEYSSAKRFCDEREMYGYRVAVFVSNVKPQDVSSLYDSRIADRMLCGTTFRLDSKSRRQPCA
jgi:DNA replication protein DnaC